MTICVPFGVKKLKMAKLVIPIFTTEKLIKT
jgi:hypothetical protein